MTPDELEDCPDKTYLLILTGPRTTEVERQWAMRVVERSSLFFPPIQPRILANSEDDLAHMRKGVSYCKRHLAQEEKAKQDPESKSAKSLMNWGHNPLKT